MENDYLWDKTGEDAEIERLENALQAFRYKETMPPAATAAAVSVPPVNVLPFRKEIQPRRAFPFALATAACLAFGILALGVWFQILKSNIEDKKDLAEITETQIVKTNSDAIPAGQSVEPALKESPIKTDPVARNPEILKKNSVRQAYKIRRSVPPIKRQKEPKSQFVRQTTPADVRLTKEEQYAYNQLMIALSFTSSKLKLVKDKVEGME